MFNNFKLNRAINREIKHHDKETKRLKKLYDDWEDDEYNCADNKFIWGIKSHDDITENPPSFYTLNDIDIYYNRKSKLYFLDIETIYKFDNRDDEKKYLNKLLDDFEQYLLGLGGLEGFDYNLDKQPRLYEFDLSSGYDLFKSADLEDLFYRFKTFVNNF